MHFDSLDPCHTLPHLGRPQSHALVHIADCDDYSSFMDMGSLFVGCYIIRFNGIRNSAGPRVESRGGGGTPIDCSMRTLGRLGCHFDFSATKGRVFKQCATKGRVLSIKCVPERVWFFQWCARESVEYQKLCKI